MKKLSIFCFSIVFNGFMVLLFRAKSVTILFPKVKGTIYHIVFVTFLFRVLSGITTTHRQPSLIIETGKHTKTNQDTPSFVQSWTDFAWSKILVYFSMTRVHHQRDLLHPGPDKSQHFLSRARSFVYFFYTSSPRQSVDKSLKNYSTNSAQKSIES